MPISRHLLQACLSASLVWSGHGHAQSAAAGLQQSQELGPLEVYGVMMGKPAAFPLLHIRAHVASSCTLTTSLETDPLVICSRDVFWRMAVSSRHTGASTFNLIPIVSSSEASGNADELARLRDLPVMVEF